MTYNVLKDKNASQNFKEAVHNMIQGKTGFTKYSIQSEDKYLAYAPVPGVKWSLGVTVPVTYVANQLRYLPIYFIVITILFGIILAFILSRWLVNPLTDLEKFSTELNDNLHKKVDNYQLNSPVIEVKSLATNFRKMVAALQETFEELRFNYEKLQSKEKLLRESERRFRSLLENVKLITGIMDKDGRIIFINDFALGLTGYKKEEVIGHSYFEIFIPDKIRENAIDWFRESLNNKEIIIHDFNPIQTKNARSELSLVEHACHRIREAVQRYNIENEEFPLSLSVGFAVSGKRKENVRDVFKEADNNMYQEKLQKQSQRYRAGPYENT